jgi:hypothetical protein
MAGWNEEMLVSLVATPWQPRSVRAAPRESLPLRLRLAVLGAVAILHLLATLALLALLDRERPPVEDAIAVDFIDAPPPASFELPRETVTIRMPKIKPKPKPASRPAPRLSTDPPAPTRVPPTAPEVPMQAIAPPVNAPLRLYNPDGSLRVPADMLDKLDEQFGDKRQFSYQIPHLDDARKYFERNPALVYEETRFDQYWTPDADALTAVLTKMVEATTKQVKMKVPGTSGSYMVCTVSILALGGGCGVLTNGADWNGPQDDPNTLNPEEERQCAAWWRQITQARTQEAWRATRKLYDQACRKPLLRPPSG